MLINEHFSILGCIGEVFCCYIITFKTDYSKVKFTINSTYRYFHRVYSSESTCVKIFSFHHLQSISYEKRDA
jgi:hypothetical protein